MSKVNSLAQAYRTLFDAPPSQNPSLTSDNVLSAVEPERTAGMYRSIQTSIVPAYRVLDTLIAVTSLVLALAVLDAPQDPYALNSSLEIRVTPTSALLIIGMILLWPSLFEAFGLYRFDELHTLPGELWRILKACAAGSIFAVAVAPSSVSGAFGLGPVLLFVVAVTTGTTLARGLSRKALSALGGAHLTEHVVLAGTGPRALSWYRELAARPWVNIIGFVDTGPVDLPFGVVDAPFLGTISDLEHILVHCEVDTVHIRLPAKSCYAAIEQVISACERVGVESRYEADMFPRTVPHTKPEAVGLVVRRKVVADDYRLWIKRAIDIAGALLLLVALSPVMLAAALAVRWSSPGPVFFSQDRFGFHRRRFRLYKFRTMVADAEAQQDSLESQNEASGPVFKIREDPRVTRVGRILRRTSIDELPQLLHVLRGEMSLVGPRPMAVRDVTRFTEAALMRRFSVRPGLTCLWQVSGRSNISFDRWVELDLAYIDNWSLLLDLNILLKTVPAVLSGTGAM